jgi:Na+:H+ antiporter, NhaA family
VVSPVVVIATGLSADGHALVHAGVVARSADATPSQGGTVTTPDRQARDDLEVRHSWTESRRFLPTTFIQPAQRFMQREAAAGIVMLAAAVVALAWANSGWTHAYEALWQTEVALRIGQIDYFDGLTLRDWVNDGAMALFFFLVVLEIKRELVAGELRNPRAAALPVIAALGGMVVPALLYAVMTAGTPGAAGWGIPMATDIAFAAGVASLAGSRVPPAAKIFLLSLAIVDDLGAIMVIALFYSHGGSVLWLGLALATAAVAAAFRRIQVRSLVPYGLLGLVCWVALHEAGVHPTVAGVIFALLTPIWSLYDPREFPRRARAVIAGIDEAFQDERFVHHEYDRVQSSLRDVARLSKETEAPLDRLEHRLGPWVSFLIVPVFALANAGLPLAGSWSAAGEVGHRVALGVALGLVIGKTIGIFAAAWLACRFGLARLPTDTGWAHILALAAAGGIGFTVSLFMTELSFTDQALVASAKLGVFAGSLIAGALGYALLRANFGRRGAHTPSREWLSSTTSTTTRST